MNQTDPNVMSSAERDAVTKAVERLNPITFLLETAKILRMESRQRDEMARRLPPSADELFQAMQRAAAALEMAAVEMEWVVKQVSERT